MTPTPFSPAFSPAPLWRRLAAAAYDALLLAALWMAIGTVDTIVRTIAGWPPHIRLLQVTLLLSTLLFFGWFWTHGGQTLGMRAWRLQLRRSDGQPLGWINAVARFGFAWLAWLPLAAGVLWSGIARDRRAWHDRWSGTDVVLLPKASSQR
jgi:uncharacterized RDD family membrane protein YckC